MVFLLFYLLSIPRVHFPILFSFFPCFTLQPFFSIHLFPFFHSIFVFSSFFLFRYTRYFSLFISFLHLCLLFSAPFFFVSSIPSPLPQFPDFITFPILCFSVCVFPLFVHSCCSCLSIFVFDIFTLYSPFDSLIPPFLPQLFIISPIPFFLSRFSHFIPCSLQLPYDAFSLPSHVYFSSFCFPNIAFFSLY